MKSTSALFLGLCAMGVFSGYVARWLGHSHQQVSPASVVAAQMVHNNGKAPEKITAATNMKSAVIEIPHVRSTDTVETLAAIKDGTLYSRLAAWMIDASETDIAAYWSGYQKGERSNDITDLVFINWTRLNPQKAIAAVAGGKDEHYAWWAWAAHDPKGALVAAIAANPDRVNNVAWGIGEFDPQWLRDHFDQIPEAARGNAMQGFVKWDDGANPLESLKFMKEHGMDFDQGTFKALVNQDPWAAYDWIKENPSLQRDHYSSGGHPMDILLSTMGREHPEDLARLAAQTPSGTLKRKMESTIFDNLLAIDPDTALENAKATEAPLIAVERYAKIGMSLVKSDPDTALEMAREIYKTSPGKLEAKTEIDYENGSTTWGGEPSPATEFLNTLISKEPAKVLDLFTSSGGNNNSQAFGDLSAKWAAQDLVGYTNWVNAQTNPEIRDSATNIIVSQLVGDGQFTDAIEWGMSSASMRNGGSLNNIFHQWGASDPAAATTWLDSSELPEDEKSRYRSIIDDRSKSR